MRLLLVQHQLQPNRLDRLHARHGRERMEPQDQIQSSLEQNRMQSQRHSVLARRRLLRNRGQSSRQILVPHSLISNGNSAAKRPRGYPRRHEEQLLL